MNNETPNSNLTSSFDYDDYARKMRSTFSSKDIINEDGSINHSYFLVKKGTYWNTKDDKGLRRGLEVFGVGAWKDIKEFELENKSEVEIELRTAILLGVKNLDGYQGKRLSSDDIEEEKTRKHRQRKKHDVKDS
eukprot:TRINITY_DN11796_c0_g1_i1.p1 TRINITY_DN11796_c0_g1~~TRINITY_DN11796_c0_g1_i1.p1  ORF type:complete len:134 (-),score=28.42 TRINITY_DN11796_c0_g1_i1:4-405(-)